MSEECERRAFSDGTERLKSDRQRPSYLSLASRKLSRSRLNIVNDERRDSCMISPCSARCVLRGKPEDDPNSGRSIWRVENQIEARRERGRWRCGQAVLGEASSVERFGWWCSAA
eukprot:6187653-Pleurochrysis_carterae.AAC.1